MMDISECLTEDTSVYLTRDRYMKKGFFYKDETPELFIKDFNHAEFVGEDICSIKRLRCAHYFIVGCGMYDLKKVRRYGDITHSYRYGIASYDFRDPSKDYVSLADYKIKSRDRFHSMLDKTVSRKNREELCHDMLEMLALDIFMGQDDRTENNVIFEIDKDHNIRLAPYFDFEYSLNPSLIGNRIQGQTKLLDLNDYKKIRDFIKSYPEFADILKSYLDIDLCDSISRAYRQRDLKLPNEKWQFYEEFEDNRQKVIKKII